MDELSNEELFNSALNDAAPEVVETTESEADTRARDEQGRFVQKTEEAEKPKPEATQETKPAEAKDEAQIPSWRLREIREERDALRQQNAELQRRFLAAQPKPTETTRPDLFEKPDEFVRSNVQEALTPLEQRLSTAIETMSRNFAVAQHGEERLTQAYSALDQAAKSGDPQAMAVVQAVKQSADPYGDIARWYAKQEASLNPQAFFQRQLEEALKDEKFKGELLTKLQPAQEKQAAKPVFQVPPSLNRAAAAAPVLDDGGDLSNESLFANALR